MKNGYRTFVIEKSFGAGRAVQRIIHHLAANNAGEYIEPRANGADCDTILFEVCVHNPLIMAWIESELAPFV